jgi:hypothetical protein
VIVVPFRGREVIATCLFETHSWLRLRWCREPSSEALPLDDDLPFGALRVSTLWCCFGVWFTASCSGLRFGGWSAPSGDVGMHRGFLRDSAALSANVTAQPRIGVSPREHRALGRGNAVRTQRTRYRIKALRSRVLISMSTQRREGRQHSDVPATGREGNASKGRRCWERSSDPKRSELHGRLQGATNLQGHLRSKPPKS